MIQKITEPKHRIGRWRSKHFSVFCLLFLLFTSQAGAQDQITARQDTLDIYGGPGVLAGKFEDAQGFPDSQGWVPVDYSEGVGNFGQLLSNLSDVDYDQDNLSPQWVFLDDGIVVPGVGPTYCMNGMYCYGPMGFVTNGLGGLLGGYNTLHSCILSPPMALPDEIGRPVLSLDAYLHNGPMPFDDMVFMVFGLEATDDPQGETGWDYYSDDFVHGSFDGEYRRKTVDFNSDLMPVGKRWVRIRMGVYQPINFGYPTPFTPAPYLDNVRLQWIGEAVAPASLPDNQLHAQAFPNPFNPTVSIKWVAPAGSTATVKVHDLTGRHVATLFDGVMADGSKEVTWRGRHDNGEPAAAGIYLCRIVAAGQSRMLKLSLVK